MSDSLDSAAVEVHLQTLDDGELLDVILAATRSRPVLAPVRDAASALTSTTRAGDAAASETTVDDSVVDEADVTIEPDPQPEPEQPGFGQSGVGQPGLAQPTSMPGPDASRGFTADGTPTFDAVRDRLEGRAARAMGTTELDAESAAGRTEREKFEERERAGKAKLEEIRRSMKP